MVMFLGSRLAKFGVNFSSCIFLLSPLALYECGEYEGCIIV